MNQEEEKHTTSQERHDPYQSLRLRDYRLLLVGNFIASLGEQMLSVALGWEFYERTHSAFLLGLVNLIQITPVLLLTLYAGYIADRFNRKRIILLSQLGIAAAALGLAGWSYWNGSLLFSYACLLLMGTGVAFTTPAEATLIASVVPEEVFENAAMWSSSSWQLAIVVGPALGGLLIAVLGSGTLIYALSALTALTFALLLLPLKMRAIQRSEPVGKRPEGVLRQLGEGMSFLWNTPIMLAAMALDLFAVLFGGATTLLPIFAQDILHVGPVGLGWLRAAPAVGALIVAIILARRPPFQHAGHTLLLAVAGFGAATIVFAVSRNFWLSLLALLMLGGLDNVSVVIRQTLALTRTPDEMRGRVASVSGLFITASSQLGGFESGTTAQLFGPLISVAGGGVAAILIVGIIALFCPSLRRLGTLRENAEVEQAETAETVKMA